MGGHNIESYAGLPHRAAVYMRIYRVDTHVCWRPYTRGYRAKKVNVFTVQKRSLHIDTYIQIY